MSLSLWFAVFAAAAPCAPLDGWNAGRAGKAADAACPAEYTEAHKLGTALHEMVTERTAIERRMKSLAADEQGKQRRRQRQIDNDVEAIHGVAVINGWPYEGAPKPGALK
jgi:hypothetical protein